MRTPAEMVFSIPYETIVRVTTDRRQIYNDVMLVLCEIEQKVKLKDVQ